MPDTPLGITYPASTDHTRMWEHFQTLAVDVDTLLGRKGYIADGTRNTTSASITSTETVIQSLTFTAVAGVRYKIIAVQGAQADAAPGSVIMRTRWAAGASVTSAGTLITSVIPPANSANVGTITTSVGTFVPGINGSVTVGVTLQRNTGTGNWVSFGSATMINTILIEGV